MRVKNSLKLCLGLLFSLFLMVACQKEQSITPQLESKNQKVLPQLEGVQLVENRLVFESAGAYKSAQRLLRKKGIDERAIIKKQFPSFVSMEDAYNNISEEERTRISLSKDLSGYENLLRFEVGADREISAEVNTGIFESQLLTNPKGIIQIGNKFRKIEYDNTFELSKNQYNIFISEGKVGEFLKKEPNNIIVLAETGVKNSAGRSSKKCSASTGHKKRVRGKGFYSSGSIEIISKHQKKKGWIWWRNKAVELAYSGTASWTSSVLGARTWSGNDDCSQCNYVSEVISDDGYLGGSISNISFSFTHSGESSNSASCSTSK